MNKLSTTVSATQNVVGRSVVPFTSGLVFFVWAVFWPESYGAWLGSIVGAFRAKAGF
ncbi:hypothetical protein [Bradyrhizobium sp. SZCCHNRI2049]|uniref:hypothetical protein n=1 Tax=Bradyrhizobium sp. SZCCHNRI2049 TaxID=3057287 RepID=UPI00291690BB|nr:hypothetical protein [Bradyrhizobium sp. SZCCHNRI2049]